MTYSVQKPQIPHVPSKGRMSFTDDRGVGGIDFLIKGEYVEIECTKYGEDYPYVYTLDQEQAVRFAQGILEVIKGQQDVNKYIADKIKTHMHMLAEKGEK